MATRRSTTEAEAPKQPASEMTAVVQDLQKQLSSMQAEIKRLRASGKAHEDRQKGVEAILAKIRSRVEGAGENVWYLHDRRGEKGLKPVQFRSNAKEPRAAYRDYVERSGHRYTGSGADPFYVSESDKPAA